MGDSRFARCLQGGGVYVQGGTVSIVNSQVYSNRATYVRAHVQKFPSPDEIFTCFAHVQGGGIRIDGGTVTFSSCTINGNQAFFVRAHVQNFPPPPWETHDWLVVCRAAVSLCILAQSQSSTPKFIQMKLMCVLMHKSSHRPDGKMADLPKSTLIFQLGSNFGSTRDLYVPATPATLHRPDGKIADALASTRSHNYGRRSGQL
jgi:hypothetical protein